MTIVGLANLVGSTSAKAIFSRLKLQLLTISMFELYQAFASRSTISPAFKVGIFKNKFLILAVLSSFTVIVTSMLFHPLWKFLDMSPLSIAEFHFIILISTSGNYNRDFKTHKIKKRGC